MENETPRGNTAPGLFIGIDWGDRKHDCFVIDQEGNGVQAEVEHSPEHIDEWLTKKIDQAGGRPIAIMLEQSRGSLVHALMFRENVVLYPVNPKQLSRYRESFPGGNGKTDPVDAMYLARMLLERHTTLKAWVPDDLPTRRIAHLSHQRRRAVDEQTRLRQQLIAQLKLYFPLALELFGKQSQLPLLLSILSRWSDPRKLRRADPKLIVKILKQHSVRNEVKQTEITDRIRKAQLLTTDEALITPSAMTARLLASQIRNSQKTISEFDALIDKHMKTHPDAELFKCLRGAGPALAPRLLAAFGSQRDRWRDADQLAAFSGIAPITRQSGQQRQVLRRSACPKYLRQTFHEFADSARRWCPWSRARYRMLRDRGMKHNAALRKLARTWIRILYRVWQTRTPFDSARYTEKLKIRCPEIIPYLTKT